MLLKTLQFTATILNQHIKNTFSLDRDIVLLNTIKDITSSVQQTNQNKVVLTLINLEPETTLRANPTQVVGNTSTEIRPQPYNLHVLICSNFDDYKEALKFLDTVLLFFQTHPLLNSSVFSNMPEGIDKIMFEMESLNYAQMHDIWTAIGANHQLSVVYKIRVMPSES